MSISLIKYVQKVKEVDKEIQRVLLSIFLTKHHFKASASTPRAPNRTYMYISFSNISSKLKDVDQETHRG